jgi:hypothetical protein
MQGSVNTFDLSAEQQNTASLLDRLLGKAISDRYVVDFCRLAAGAFALNVSRPIAAHALRELLSSSHTFSDETDALEQVQSLSIGLLAAIDSLLP